MEFLSKLPNTLSVNVAKFFGIFIRIDISKTLSIYTYSYPT